MVYKLAGITHYLFIDIHVLFPQYINWHMHAAAVFFSLLICFNVSIVCCFSKQVVLISGETGCGKTTQVANSLLCLLYGIFNLLENLY